MSTTTRTDAHRPSALDPAEYSWVGYSDDGDANAAPLCDGPLFAPEAPIGALGPSRHAHVRERRAANPSGVRNAIHPGGCDACGQMGLRYRHYFRHNPTGDVIVLGDQCVARMDFPSTDAYAAARKVAAQRERAKQDAAAAEWRAANPDVAAALDEYADEHYILADMAAKLRRYGSLSERQVEFIWKLVAETKERLENPPEPEPDPEPIPTEIIGERVVLTGVVLGTKFVENGFGGTTKMLFRDDRNFKLWGTLPSFGGPAKGERVTFTARVETSPDDPCFGFFSRPTKAALL